MSKFYLLPDIDYETSLKGIIKSGKCFVKKLLGRNIVSHSTGLALYCDPKDFELVGILWRGVLPNWLILNDKEINTVSGERQGIYTLQLLNASYFKPWENLLAWPAPSLSRPLQIVPIAENIIKTRILSPFPKLFWYKSPLRKGEGILMPLENEKFSQKKVPFPHVILNFLKNSINNEPSSNYKDCFHFGYDIQNQTWRLDSWNWASSICIAALSEDTLSSETINIITRVAEKILTLQQEADSEMKGGWMIRRDVAEYLRNGFSSWYSPNDVAIAAYYTAATMTKLTGDTKWYEMARLAAQWIYDSGIGPNGLRIGWCLETRSWEDDMIYIDAGFTPTVFAWLYTQDHDSYWKSASCKIMDDLIHRLENGTPYFNKLWFLRKKPNYSIFARGQAWFLEGLLPCIEITGRKDFVCRAKSLVNALINDQRNDGSWNYVIHGKDSHPCGKSVPVIGALLAKAGRILEMPKARIAAKRALEWCRQNIISETGTLADGGILSVSEEGLILPYCRGVKCTVLYAAAYTLMLNTELQRH